MYFFTTRKSEKTYGHTDRIFSLEIFTDRKYSVSKSVGIYRQIQSIGDTVGIYRWNTSVGIYRSYRRQTIQFF